jgi:signal transduction histidine kinase/ligand-binding sensor domain-containing protein
VKSIHILLITLWAIGALQTTGQQQAPAYMKLSESSYYQWTGENGLISNNITSAIQAQSGFIWITTYNGLMRFDGVHVDVYDRGSLPFLSTDAFYRVYEDKKGMLWFASQGSGIIKYNGRKFSALTVQNGIIPKSSRCLLIDDSIKWVGSNNEGLFKIQNNKIEPVKHHLLEKITILALAKDDQYLWIATDGQGLMGYDEKMIRQFTTDDGLSSNTINAICVAPDGVYAGTNEGVDVIKGEKISSLSFLKNIHITDVANDAAGRIWIATDNGLARLDPATNETELEGEKNGYPFNRVNSLAFDKEGGLWMGTGRNGLIQLKEPNIINLTTYQGLSLNRSNIVYEHNNQFYIGSDAGHLDVFRNGKIQNLPIRTPLNEAAIRDICIDNDGATWVASYKGVIRMKNGTEKLIAAADGLPANDVRRILKGMDGSLWIATRSAGIARYAQGKFISYFDKKHGLESDYVLAVEQDSLGVTYVGTHSGGLTVIQRDESCKTFHLTPNDAGVLIFNVHITSPQKIFIVSNIGLYFFDGQIFTRIETDRTYKGETHFDWAEDFVGNVWLSTNIGILKIKKTDIDLFLQHKLDKVPTKIIDNQDGMKSKECTGATRMLVSSTGKVWVPTIGGVSVLYPENMVEIKMPPPVYVTSLEIDSDTLTESGAVVQPGNLHYVLNYTALSYKSPAKALFKYKLEGIDEEWQEAGQRRFVEYTNLSPGSYTFRVMGCNSDGIWNTEGASFQFQVLPFFYQTVLFYALVATVFLLITYSIYQWRLRAVVKSNAELKKLNEQLDNFVYSTSHDLRAPLTSIMGLINLSRLEAENRPEYINLIEKSVKKMDEFINEITDFSRNARLSIEAVEINFNKLIQETFEHLAFLDINNKIEKTVIVEGSSPFYSDKLRLAIILNNLVTNAIKYSNANQPKPRIEVHVHIDPSRVIIRISDNGIGIRQAQLGQIFDMFYRGSEQSQGSGLGLYIVKETIHKLSGEIKVNSEFGMGSTFEVRLPNLK